MPEDKPRGEFVMGNPMRSIEIPEAAMQFFVEAMRANTNTLERVSQSLLGVQAEAKEQFNLLNDVRERVIRIEATPRVDKEISELKERLRKVELEDARNEGSTATWDWVARYFPSIAMFLLAIVGGIFLVMAASDKFQTPAPVITPVITKSN